jgi:hypothetical protein
MKRSLLFLAASSAVAQMTVPANDPRITWVGRRVVNGDGSVSADWSSTEARFMVNGANTVKVTLTEGNGGGQRYGVWVNNSQTMVPSRAAAFWASPADGANVSYPMVGGWVLSGSTEVRLMRTVEPTFAGPMWSASSRVISFSVDEGNITAVPPPASGTPRRIEFVGDSITAAMGDLGTFSSNCPGSGLTSDYSFSYVNQICLALGAECSTLAWSGISLSDPSTGPGMPGCPQAQCTMPNLYGYALANKINWDFSQWKPAAVHINLGTNDGRNNNWSNSTFVALFESDYVAFVRDISALNSDEASRSIQYFLAVGPMSMAYNTSAHNVASTLTGLGYHATVLDYSLPDYSAATAGCEWHPTSQLHKEMAAKNVPVIQQVMGWK